MLILRGNCISSDGASCSQLDGQEAGCDQQELVVDNGMARRPAMTGRPAVISRSWMYTMR